MKHPSFTSEQIFELGYAIPLYDITTQTQIFRFRGQTRRIEAGAAPMTEIGGWPAAKWEDVLMRPEAL